VGWLRCGGWRGAGSGGGGHAGAEGAAAGGGVAWDALRRVRRGCAIRNPIPGDVSFRFHLREGRLPRLRLPIVLSNIRRDEHWCGHVCSWINSKLAHEWTDFGGDIPRLVEFIFWVFDVNDIMQRSTLGRN
jgi:hypothetical protein